MKFYLFSFFLCYVYLYRGYDDEGVRNARQSLVYINGYKYFSIFSLSRSMVFGLLKMKSEV